MKDEFIVIFYRFPHVLSEEFMYCMDIDVEWSRTTQESWYDYCSMYCAMSV